MNALLPSALLGGGACSCLLASAVGDAMDSPAPVTGGAGPTSGSGSSSGCTSRALPDDRASLGDGRSGGDVMSLVEAAEIGSESRIG